MFRGLSYILTGTTSISIENSSFLAIDSSTLFFIPVPVLLLVVFYLGSSVFLNKTVIGSRIYAVGGDEHAARVLGLPVGSIKIFVYTLSGSLAAVGGIMGASKVSSSYPLAGSGYEFEVIAAVIIGGALMEGGKGTVLGVILGAIFIGILKNSIVQVGISQYWQQAVSGFAIIFVLMMSIIVSKTERR